jgi:hypothetical protein
VVYEVMKPGRSDSAQTAVTVQQPVTPATESQPRPTPESPVSGAPAVDKPAAVVPSRSDERRPAARTRETVRPARRHPVSTPAPAASARQPAALEQTAPQQQAAQNTTPAAAQNTGGLVWSPPAPSAAPESKVVEEKKPERVPQTVTIPAGTLLSVRVDQKLSTETNQTGDSFRATLDQPLVVDGFVIAERGARVEGRVVEADPGGRVKGLSRISLELVRLNSADGQRLRLQTESFAKEGQNEKKRDVAKVGAAAGIGAAIGAIAGGGKGAALGAVLGGAAGTGGVMATRGAAAEIPAETRMTFRLREAIGVTEKLP